MLYYPYITQMLSYIQIILGVVLVALILMQQSDSALGGAFGGADSDNTGHTRRGPELWIFRASIAVAILFVAAAIVNLLY